MSGLFVLQLCTRTVIYAANFDKIQHACILSFCQDCLSFDKDINASIHFFLVCMCVGPYVCVCHVYVCLVCV